MHCLQFNVRRQKRSPLSCYFLLQFVMWRMLKETFFVYLSGNVWHCNEQGHTHFFCCGLWWSEVVLKLKPDHLLSERWCLQCWLLLMDPMDLVHGQYYSLFFGLAKRNVWPFILLGQGDYGACHCLQPKLLCAKLDAMQATTLSDGPQIWINTTWWGEWEAEVAAAAHGTVTIGSCWLAASCMTPPPWRKCTAWQNWCFGRVVFLFERQWPTWVCNCLAQDNTGPFCSCQKIKLQQNWHPNLVICSVAAFAARRWCLTGCHVEWGLSFISFCISRFHTYRGNFAWSLINIALNAFPYCMGGGAHVSQIVHWEYNWQIPCICLLRSLILRRINGWLVPCNTMMPHGGKKSLPTGDMSM